VVIRQKSRKEDCPAWNFVMTRIYLVEDHHIVREGIKSIIQLQAGLEVVGEAASGELLLDEFPNLKPQLIISDISLIGIDGVELTRILKKNYPGINVLIVSMHADQQLITECLEAGADGYLLKDFRNEELLSAIEKIMQGEKYISRSASEILTQHLLSSVASSKNPKIELTRREKEIIEFISLGLSNKEIAEKIFLSTSTVDAHRYNILKKMDVKNTAEMITKAIKLKILILR